MNLGHDVYTMCRRLVERNKVLEISCGNLGFEKKKRELNMKHESSFKYVVAFLYVLTVFIS